MTSCPLPYPEIVDTYFMEHRAKLIDIAAFLDRLDRAVDSPAEDDFRVASFRRCLEILLEEKAGRARRVLEALSDHTSELPLSASGKGAVGAPPV